MCLDLCLCLEGTPFVPAAAARVGVLRVFARGSFRVSSRCGNNAVSCGRWWALNIYETLESKKINENFVLHFNSLWWKSLTKTTVRRRWWLMRGWRCGLSWSSSSKRTILIPRPTGLWLRSSRACIWVSWR